MENISYDGIFKELLDEFPAENVVDFINKLFERSHSRDSEVIKLETESHVDGKERRSDKIIRIGGDMYHVEIQSGDDNSIALRIFEYSYRAALQHGKTLTSGSLTLDFPKSVVFYLRTTAQTPTEITITLNLPDGTTTTYTTPVRLLKEYKLEDLIQDSSLIFAPYYPMLFEGESLKSPEMLKKLENECIFIIDKIKEKANNGEIGRKTTDLIVKSLEDILFNVMVKSKLSKEEVDETMEAVARKYVLEPLNWREEGIVIGFAKGKAEEEARMKKAIMKMLARGDSIEEIQDVTGYEAAEIEKIRSEMQK